MSITTERTRPPVWELDRQHPLANQLAFFGGGRIVGETQYWDSSGNFNHGTLTGYSGTGDTPADRWSRDLGRPVLGCDGSNDYVSTPQNLYAYGIRRAWTVAAWIKLSATTNYSTLFSDFDVVGSFNGIALRIDAGATSATVYQYPYGGAGEQRVVGTYTFAVGTWYHLAALADGAKLRLYVNGVEIGTAATLSYDIGNSANSLKIGARGDLAATYWFQGSTADAVLYSRGLTVAELRQLADPSNVMLSGLLRTRRKWWPVGATGTPLSVPNRSIGLDLPVNNGDHVDTMVATGGTVPYSWQIVSQTAA